MFSNEPRCIYRSNQLAEVICQLRFPEILKIPTETPAAFQDAIREDFPRYARRMEPPTPHFPGRPVSEDSHDPAAETLQDTVRMDSADWYQKNGGSGYGIAALDTRSEPRENPRCNGENSGRNQSFFILFMFYNQLTGRGVCRFLYCTQTPTSR